MNVFVTVWRAVGPTAPALGLLYLMMTAIVLTEVHLLRRKDTEEKNEDLVAFVHLLRTGAQMIAAIAILVGLGGTLWGLNSKVLPALGEAIKAGGASEAALGVVAGFKNVFLSTLGGLAVAIEGEIALFMGFLLSGDGDHLGLISGLLKKVVEERSKTAGTDVRYGLGRVEFSRPSVANAVRSQNPPVPSGTLPDTDRAKNGVKTAPESQKRRTAEKENAPNSCSSYRSGRSRDRKLTVPNTERRTPR